MANLHDDFEKEHDLHAEFDKEPDMGSSESRYSPDAKQYSELESAGKGVQQGATLGFADELAALSGAAGAKYGGDERNFWDVYKDVLGTVRPEYKAAEEQNPISSFTGNLAGGMLVPAGLVGKAAKPGATFAQKAGNIALTGARAGAIAGLGGSEADLTSGESGQIKQAVEDTAGSAALGAGLGLGISAGVGAGKGAFKAGKDIVGSFPIVQDIKEMFLRTKGGEEFLNKLPEMTQKNREIARGVIDKLEELRRSSGGARQQNLQDLEKSGVKIDINKIVDDLNSQVDKMEAIHPAEQADIDNFKQVLKNLVKEQTTTETKLVAKNLPPQPTPEELAQQSLAKRTAAAQTKDDIIIKNLSEQIENETDADVIAALKKKRAKLIDNTVYPPETKLEPTTDMNVASVNRGINKAPLVAPIAPAQEPLFTPLQKITNEVTTRGRTEASPTQVGEFLKSFGTGADQSETYVGRQLAKQGKEALSTALDTEAQKVGAVGQNLNNQFDQNTSNFKNVADTQQLLGLPDYFGARDKSDKVGAINKLQNYVKNYHKGDSQSKLVIDEALNELEKSFPDEAAKLRNAIEQGSKNEYLAGSLTEERKAFGLGAAAKSKAMLGARFAGQAARGIENANPSQALVNVGRNIYNSSPTQVQQMADAAAKVGGAFGTTTAKTLSTIINAPDAKRRAILFTLMQQPDFREFAKQFTPDL